MLQGLPRIQHKSVQLAHTVLVTSLILALAKSFHLRDRSTIHHLWVRLQHHVLHLVHLAHLDEMQDASA